MKTDIVSAEIIEDTEDIVNVNLNDGNLYNEIKTKKRIKNPTQILKNCLNDTENIFEIGVDEVGRGPLFGRVYTAAVVIPKDGSFDCSKVKDSKKYHSKNKIEAAAEYIKTHASFWSVNYIDEKKIDDINILQATQLSMHNSINNVLSQIKKKKLLNNLEFNKDYNVYLLIDGNYFNPMEYFNKYNNRFENIPYETIEGGDNKYASIAAASILAKVERDKYIEEICQEYPELIEKYGINTNKGYGAKKHMDGIKEHGITIWHRRSFAPCKYYV